MKKLFGFLAALVMVFCTPTVVMAQHHQGQPRPREEYRPPCATPEQMALVIKTLQNQSIDEKRLEVAQLCVTIGHFCTDDLAQIAQTFSFDEKRLEFLKYAYPYCVDPERYPALRECFSFESNFKALLDYIYPPAPRR